MTDDTQSKRVADVPRELHSYRDKYLAQLQERLGDPLHRRIVAAYQKKENPVESMEAELGVILTEFLQNED